MLRPCRVVRSVGFSLNRCGFTACWISRYAFLADVPTQRAEKIKVIIKFPLDLSDSMVDLPDNMSGRHWKIISKPAIEKYYLQHRFWDLFTKLMKCLIFERYWNSHCFSWFKNNLPKECNFTTSALPQISPFHTHRGIRTNSYTQTHEFFEYEYKELWIKVSK